VDAIKEFFVSTHARIRGSERGIPSIQDMKDVVNYHDKKTQQYRGKNGGFVYKFSKKVRNQTIVVVAEVKKQKGWLISVWSE
jgi:hypothetical protein